MKLAESIAIPLTFVLLAFVFGALVASAMPLVIGISAILGSFLLIFIFLYLRMSAYLPSISLQVWEWDLALITRY